MLYSYKDLRGNVPRSLGHIGTSLELGGFKGQKNDHGVLCKLVEVGEKEGSRRPLGHYWLSKGFEFFLVESFGRY